METDASMKILAAILGIILGISGFGFWKLLFSLIRCIASCIRIAIFKLIFLIFATSG